MKNEAWEHESRFMRQEIKKLKTLIKKTVEDLIELKHQDHHTINEEVWRINKIIKKLS